MFYILNYKRNLNVYVSLIMNIYQCIVDQNIWNAVRDFITFFSFLRLCLKFNTFFAFTKLSFLKTILTSYNVSIIRLLRIPHKTLSRPSIKSACVLKNVYLNKPAQKLCLGHFWRHSNRLRRVTEIV